MKNFYCAFGNGQFMKLHMVTFSDLSLERPCPYCVTDFTAFSTVRTQESILIFLQELLVISALTPLYQN